MNQTESLIEHISRTNRCGSWQGLSYRFLCPYCQTGTKNSKGKTYTPSDAKGYIYSSKKGSYEYWNFKCFKSSCSSNKSFRIEKLIRDHYPELLTTEQKEELVIQNLQKFNSSPKFNQKKSEQNFILNSLSEDRSYPSSSIQKLPRSSPQHQAGKGSVLEQKLKQQKASRAKNNKWEQKIPPVI